MLLLTIGFRGSKSNGPVFWCWRPHMWHGGLRSRKVRNDSVWNIILFWYPPYILLFRTLYAVEFDSNAAYTFSQNHPYGCHVIYISDDFSSLILRFICSSIIYIFLFLCSFPQTSFFISCSDATVLNEDINVLLREVIEATANPGSKVKPRLPAKGDIDLIYCGPPCQVLHLHTITSTILSWWTLMNISCVLTITFYTVYCRASVA